MELTQGVRFDTLELSPEILRALLERNIVQSTPVQAGCIPPMLEWRDVIAKAPTGTGKTFAYGIPIVEHIDPEDESVQAVILAPTRELAIQITDELRILYTYKPGIRAVCLYGGAPIGLSLIHIWGQRGASCEVAYSCTKAGIIALTRSLACLLYTSTRYPSGRV